jgi:Right handed beta helix region/Putative metal-binding motif
MRNTAWLSVLSIFTLLLVQTLFSQPAGLLRFVNNTDSTCQGHAPCYATIQAAVDAAESADTIRIQAGTYDEAVVISGKNTAAGATEADRIVIEADPTAPTGSVVMGKASQKCGKGDAIHIEQSQFITIRGLAITEAGGQAIELRGGKKQNAAIHLERNRLFGNGTSKCQGGILVGAGNLETLIVNNLIYGNGQQGVAFSAGTGGPHYVVSNTIQSNGRNGVSIGKDQEVWLVNNSIIGNGTDPKSAAKDGFGVEGVAPTKKGQPEQALLLHNLICGNAAGELSGLVLDSMDAGNLTPTGTEGPGVSARPTCGTLATVYANLPGPDGQENTADDDFLLAIGSPAIDQGEDPRTVGLDPALDPLFTEDFTGEGKRPQDGDQNGTAEFDIGAVEKNAGTGGGCLLGETRSCYTGSAGTEGVGICHGGTQTCGAGGTFGPCLGQVVPSAEICNGQDDDCNGQTDENLGQATCGVGACQRTVDNCVGGVPQTCTPGNPTTEVCGNTIDEDCDGQIDDPDVCSGGNLPPDPSTVAPPLDRSVATDLATATAFLYTGNNPIQTGVALGTIEARRAAVLRGKVLTRDGQPLSGVTITILHHAEFGQTLSRADGMFDLVVNGGGPLTVNYHKAGFLSAQRQLTVPWQNYAWLPDVVLVSVDPQVTTVDLTAATPIQVARGRVQSDTDGTRQATLLFPQGTQAQMVLPDGSTQPITTLSVRATEFTVGPTGPQAMPAALPPASVYTYAVEFTADEAEAFGATQVHFSQPVIAYVENFLHYPVGGLVPVGFYDRQAGLWIPSNNGRALQIVSITNGFANVDLDGSGQVASASALAALGITDAERQQLAALYQPGQSLWRMSILHFTAYDENLDVNCPSCSAPDSQAPTTTESTCPNTASGSTIECQNQILGEALDITGTPFSLHYQSDRVPGRKANNTLEIPLSGATVSQDVTRIELEVLVAGRKFVQRFPAAPNQRTTFTWDGQDAYQRPLQGEQLATVTITYFYKPHYKSLPSGTGEGAIDAAIFGLSYDGPLWDPARQEFYAPRTYETTIGTLDARAQGVGGWSLDVHHAYNPVTRVLHLGDGSRRSGDSLGQIITTVAGGFPGYGGDGGPAVGAQLGAVQVTVGPDGSFYISSSARIRRVDP